VVSEREREVPSPLQRHRQWIVCIENGGFSFIDERPFGSQDIKKSIDPGNTEMNSLDIEQNADTWFEDTSQDLNMMGAIHRVLKTEYSM